MSRFRLSAALIVATAGLSLCLVSACGSSAEIADDTLDDSVSQRLRAEPALRNFDIDVDVDDGIVTLDGSVGAESDRMAAERIARSTAGVKGVTNEIDVGEEPPAVGAPGAARPGTPPGATPGDPDMD